MQITYRVSKYGQVYHSCSGGCDECSDYWYGCGRHKIYKRYRFTRDKIKEILNSIEGVSTFQITTQKHSYIVVIEETNYNFINYLIKNGWRDVPTRIWIKEVTREEEEKQSKEKVGSEVK